MICHETYQGQNGNWLQPNMIEKKGAMAFLQSNGEAVKVGRSVKMSKSKNIIDPEEIVKSYGADTARLFVLSDSPPERDLEWTEAGIEGAWRYINRLWRMVKFPAGDRHQKQRPYQRACHSQPMRSGG